MASSDYLQLELARVSAHAPDLIGSIAQDQIETVYQPQFALDDDALVGGEALARWHHPVLGTIGAQTTFAIAEDQDAAVRLSEHVVDAALAQFATWPGHLRLSVNILPQEISANDFALRFLARVRESRVDPERLTVEITEDVLLGDLRSAALALGSLRDAGVAIALDDFGAGFCNFGYLKVLPLDYLKLDRSMVEGIATDHRDLAILRGIATMADALGLDVIAEGIEREAQRAIVAAEGCKAYQGFLRSAPVDATSFRQLALAQAAF
ncbi:EAL domain-containing protein [Qipengyuania sp. CAU 1752]